MEYNVIIVDDDRVSLFLHRTFVIKCGLSKEPACFPEARSALDVLRSESKPTLLLLDINMPGMSGWELLDGIASNATQTLDVIIVSSSINTADKEKAATYAQVKGYISKPLSVEKLQSFMIENLNGR